MKKNILFSLSFAIVVFVFCLMLSENAEAASQKIMNCSNHSGSPAGARWFVIDDPGDYKITDQINASGNQNDRFCIYVNASNVLINCSGAGIITGEFNKTGIFINGTDVNITNCKFLNFSTAIEYGGSRGPSNLIIFNNTFRNINYTIFNTTSLNSSNISGNTFYNNLTKAATRLWGFWIIRGLNNIIENNTLSNVTSNNTFGIGILLSLSLNNTLSTNIISQSNISIELNQTSENNTITTNTIRKHTIQGIFLDGVDFNVITTNTISSNQSFGTPGGITVVNGLNNSVLANTIFNCSRGIVLNDVNHSRIFGNTVTNSSAIGEGITILAGTNFTVTSNTVQFHKYGFSINNTNLSTFTNNTADSSDFGFLIDSSSENNTFTRCRARSNFFYGLWIREINSVYNTFTQLNASNPRAQARDININANLSIFRNCRAGNFANASLNTLMTIFSFDNYNGTQMNISAVKDIFVPSDPALFRNISRYLNITRPAADTGGWMIMNFTYASADINNLLPKNSKGEFSFITPSTLHIERYNGTAWINNPPISYVFTGQLIVSANLTTFSEFGVFGTLSTPAVHTGGSSGGPGGAASTAVNLDAVSEVTRVLRKFDKLSFIRKNEIHKLTNMNIDTVSKEVTIKLESTPKVLTIKETQTVHIDTDDNGYYDLDITVESLDAASATFTLQKVNEQTAPRPTAQDQMMPGKETIGKEMPPSREPYREDLYQAVEPEKKSNIFWIFIIVIAVIIVGWIIFEVAKKGKKR